MHSGLAWAWLVYAVFLHVVVGGIFFIFVWTPLVRSPGGGVPVSLDLLAWCLGGYALGLIVLGLSYFAPSGVYRRIFAWYWHESPDYNGERHVPAWVSVWVIGATTMNFIFVIVVGIFALIVNHYFTKDGLATTNVSTLPGVDFAAVPPVFDNAIRYYALIFMVFSMCGWFLISTFPAVLGFGFTSDLNISQKTIMERLGITTAKTL